MGIQSINQLPNKSTASNQDILIHQKIFANDPRLYAIKKKDLINPTNKLVRYSKQAPDTVNTSIKPRGQGTILNPYKISCLANLIWMQQQTTYTYHYLQTHNIDCNAIQHLSIETFNGQYNGNGKIISNLKITTNTYRGLFGNCTTAIIKNVHIKNANITSGGTLVGALCGQISNSVVSNCIVENSNIVGVDTIYAQITIGCIIGQSLTNSKIINCLSLNNTTNDTTNNGGIVGILNASTIMYCISNSNIIGGTNRGGLIGSTTGTVKIENIFYDKDNSGTTDTDRGTPLTTQQMKNIPLHYLKLDTSVWKRDANGIPQLWSHQNPAKYSKKVLILANNSTSMAYPTKAFTVSQILHSLPTSSVKLVGNQTHNISITGIDGNVYNYPFAVEQVKTKQNDGMIKQSQVFSSGNYSLVDSIPKNSILDSITFRRIATGSLSTIVVRRNGTGGVVLGTASLNHPVDSVAKVQLNRKYFSDDFTSSLNLNFSTTTNCQVSVKYSTDYTNQIITILD